MSKKKPLKPNRPIGVLVFPKEGAPYTKSESLPRTQKELELNIGQKLLASIQHTTGQIYQDLRLGDDEPADLVCKNKDGKTVEIQVAELVHLDIVSVQNIRRAYREYIEANHLTVLNKFSGCRVNIVDSGSRDFLPKVDSKVGKRYIKVLVSALKDFADTIDSLKVGKRRSKNLLIIEGEYIVSVICERIYKAGDDKSFIFDWTGGIVPSISDFTIFSDTLMQKICKMYTKPQSEFWLLTYTTEMPITLTSHELKRAQDILDKEKHPFDIVWYLHPAPHRPNSHLIKVWPAV